VLYFAAGLVESGRGRRRAARRRYDIERRGARRREKDEIDPYSLVSYDRSGNGTDSTWTAQNVGSLRISPDAQRVAVDLADPRGAITMTRLARSFPKREQRIHSGHAAGGQIARSKRDEHQHCGGGHECDRIGWAESREERGQRRRDQK